MNAKVINIVSATPIEQYKLRLTFGKAWYRKSILGLSSAWKTIPARI